jgi:hypothetical protein
MSRERRIVKVQSAGVTSVAVALDVGGARVVLAQPTEGRRLQAGDEVSVPTGSLPTIVENWMWVDAGLAEARRTASAAREKVRRAAIEAYVGAMTRAASLLWSAPNAAGWETALRAFAAAMPPPRLGAEGSTETANADRAAGETLSDWIEAREEEGAPMRAVDALVEELFPHGVVRPLVPLPEGSSSSPFLAALRAWAPITPRDHATLESIVHDRRLRAGLASLQLDVHAYWEEETNDTRVVSPSPGSRYFVIAGMTFDTVFFAVDAADPTGPLWKLSWQHGEREPERGPPSFRALIEERVAWNRDAAGGNDAELDDHTLRFVRWLAT